MSDKRPRTTVSATLVIGERLDDEIIEYKKEMSENRQWIPAFKAALKLYMSLLDSDTQVLKRMFPDLWEYLKSEAREEIEKSQPSRFGSPKNPSTSIDDGARNWEKIKQTLDKNLHRD